MIVKLIAATRTAAGLKVKARLDRNAYEGGIKISQTWRGKPLISHEVIVKLIAATRTAAGLTVRARLDRHAYPDGIRISQAEVARVRLRPDAFHGDWNYTILPSPVSRYRK